MAKERLSKSDAIRFIGWCVEHRLGPATQADLKDAIKKHCGITPTTRQLQHALRNLRLRGIKVKLRPAQYSLR